MPQKPGHRPAEERSDAAAIPKPIQSVPICHSGTSKNPKAHLPPTSSPTDPPTPNDRNDKEPSPPQRPWDTRSDRNRRPPPNARKRPGRHSQANLDLNTFSMMKTKDAGLALHSIRRNHPERAGESLQSGSDLAQSDEPPRRRARSEKYLPRLFPGCHHLRSPSYEGHRGLRRHGTCQVQVK